ncbi:FmdB family zinc ribbon protein [Actinotalea sp.]|uniref:FmdB family zinc ribbon protein n=1 Tax=Actinotalea sp. TaxID=1872145 RepID=UPI0035687AE6
MPTYSYACTDCGHRFDAQQAFTDDALTSCPECGGRLRKMFGNVGVVFKGSGFYRTDARAEGKRTGARGSSSSSSASTAGESSSGPSSEGKASSNGDSSSTSGSGASSTSGAGSSSTTSTPSTTSSATPAG